jgi:hypothetical protein
MNKPFSQAQKNAQPQVSGPKRLIKSVKSNAGSPEEQDETIKRLAGEGWDYLDTTMIYGGQMVIRFEKRG